MLTLERLVDTYLTVKDELEPLPREELLERALLRHEASGGVNISIWLTVRNETGRRK